MNTLTIGYTAKTALIEALLEENSIKELVKRSWFQKLKLSSKKYPDIYFYQGKKDKEFIEKAQHSKKVIVNSHHAKNEIMQQAFVPDEKCVVSYPCFKPRKIAIKAMKKEFLEDLAWDKQTKIIFFTANSLKANGIKEFIQIILSLNSTNFRVIIASDTQQITNLRFQISKFNFADRVILYENFENIDLLFAVSDIFVLPTSQQNFASNIVKAMYYKTAVFVTQTNASREIVDVFATMASPDDPSTAFKIDALLSRNEDLKNIKKQNHKIAKQFTLKKELKKMHKIIADLSPDLSIKQESNEKPRDQF